MGVSNEILGVIYGREPSFFDSIPNKIEAYKSLGIDGSMLEFGDTWGYAVPSIVINHDLFVDGMGNMFSYSVQTHTSYKGPMYVGGYLGTPEKYDEFHKRYPLPEPIEWRSKSISLYRKAVKVAGDEFLITPVTGGILEKCTNPIGFKNFFRYLFTDPLFIKRILEVAKKRTIELTKIYIDEGAEVIGLYDDYSDKHGPMISPRHWVQFVFPHLKEIADICHKRGTLLLLHSCGNVEPLIKFIIEAGVDAIQSLEPTAGIRLDNVKKDYGDKICLVGNIDLNTLALGTKKEVATLVKESIMAAASGGGYMLGATHGIYSLTADLKKISENLLTISNTIKKYGIYSS
jgi:uroporphyrinogen decarboxylase